MHKHLGKLLPAGAHINAWACIQGTGWKSLEYYLWLLIYILFLFHKSFPKVIVESEVLSL